jgi:hypothetical protein
MLAIMETARKVATILRTFGHAATEVWGVIEWRRFKQLVHQLPGAGGLPTERRVSARDSRPIDRDPTRKRPGDGPAPFSAQCASLPALAHPGPGPAAGAQPINVVGLPDDQELLHGTS